MVSTPVLLMVFNRIETTSRVFQVIRAEQPAKLYLASDGPREGRPGEREKVMNIREYLLANIDWPCEVKTLFRDANRGCKFGLIEAISWFFEHEEMGIVLEDDCLPHVDFFGFCEQLLTKYRDRQDVYAISGTNIKGVWPSDGDYFFSMMGGNWGWASWSRAWKRYRMDIEADRTRENWSIIASNLNSPKLANSVKAHLNQSGSNMDSSAWDYQWLFIRMLEGGKSIVPAKNLIANIGFGEDSTHTSDEAHPLANLPTHPMARPLRDPASLEVNIGYDLSFCPYWHHSLTTRVANRILKLFRRA